MEIVKSSYGRLSAALYDEWLPTFDAEEIAFWKASLPIDARVLELMCGTGRLLHPLNAAGFEVDGIDASQAMIARCREKTPPGQRTPCLRVSDIFASATGRSYAAAFCSSGSFQLGTGGQRDLPLALQNAAQHVVGGGFLLIDFFVPQPEERTPVNSSRRLRRDVMRPDGTRARCWEKVSSDIERQRIQSQLDYEVHRGNDLIDAESETITLDWFTPNQVVCAARDAGLSCISLTRGYTSERATAADISFVLRAKAQ